MRCAAIGASRTAFIRVLNVTFKEDLSRLRIGHGAHNMAVVRHFALNLVRQAKDKRQPSSDGVKSLHRIRNTSPKCYNSSPVNLNSLP